MVSRAGLPEVAAAVADPAKAAAEVAALVRASLQEEWRSQNSDLEVLDALADLLDAHLDALGSTAGEAAKDHEEACAVCLKLARNLCTVGPSVQQHWRRRGLVEKLAPRLRSDLVREEGERSVPWREAVTSFLANLVAGHPELRVHALLTLFPYGLAAVFTLCWHKPHLAFVLAQNLFAPSSSGEDGNGPPLEGLQRLLETPEGHCLLLVLLSLVQGEGDPEDAAVDAQAKEWATIFFHDLWLRGGFPLAYRGIRRLSAATLHCFLCQAAVPAGAAPEVAALALSRLAPRLCGRADAVGWLWHTVHGLLAGPSSDEASSEETAAAATLASAMLGDAAFVCLAAEEMAEACEQLATAWGLPWKPTAVSQEACEALGLEPADLDISALAAAAADDGNTDQLDGATPSAEAAEQDAASALWEKGAGGPFEELMQAAKSLSMFASAAGRSSGGLPPRLTGLYLTANVALVEALHARRFGDLASGEAAKKGTEPEAVAAAHACLLIDQVRLIGNVLYGQLRAQRFARLTRALRAVLSHCYADNELPLLREAGVFAVRNATHNNPENQQAVRELLAERKAAGVSDGALQPPPIELDFAA